MVRESPALEDEGGSGEEVVPPQLELDVLQTHVRFPEAMRFCASNMVRLHNRGRIMGWFLSDRTLAILAHAAVSLAMDARGDDPQSGLSPGSFKAFCTRTGMCGEGRATAILAFMRLTGHLEAEVHPADRRITRLLPSGKMLETMRSRLAAEFAAVAMVCPEVAAAADLLGSEDFEREMARQFLKRWRIGKRFLDHAPALRLFAERDVGMLILFALMLGADPSKPFPPAEPVPLSIAALARYFHVSRTHVLRLIRDAEAAGLVTRLGDKGELVSLSPKLQDGLRRFFATLFQFTALCAWRSAVEEGQDGG
jgi:hypothetical protein